MPHLSPDLSNSAFFLFRRNPKTGEIDGPWGTGVVVCRPSKENEGESHCYAVSNWHVACKTGASILRFNTDTGPSRFIELEPDEWQFIPRGDDLAAVDISEYVDMHADRLCMVAESAFVTSAFIKEVGLGMGEDVCMIGLFANHHGGARNLPAGRFGNISAMASEDAPLEQPNGSVHPTHVLDMRSRTGFSGSPVFVYRTPDSDLVSVNEGGPWVISSTINNLFLRLLGIHCGQFPEDVKFTKAERLGDPILEGDTVTIPSSMTLVVPAWRISELLDMPAFERQRAERDARKKKHAKGRAVPEAVSAPPTTEENPSHREDFNSLVSAAAKTPRSRS
jgi:hypothetical protein